MLNDLILTVFQFYSPHLPADWNSLTIFYKADESSAMSFVEYSNSSGNKFHPGPWLSMDEEYEVLQNLKKMTPYLKLTNDGITHVELKITVNGEFETMLGYGPIDWEEVWPDDISAETYTYSD